MARGVQLIQLVSRLRAEVGHSSNAGVGVDKLPELKQILRRTQESLYDDFDWPHLRIKPTKSLASGQRYYDFPADLNYDRIQEAAVWYNGQPHIVERGIGFNEYARYDSDSGDESDPMQRWDVRWTGSSEQCEVWPIPTSNDMTLQFVGIRDLADLTSNADTCDLDDILIILFAAAEILARQKSQDANAKLSAAQARYSKLKGRTRGASRPFVMGGGEGDYRRGPTVIRVS